MTATRLHYDNRSSSSRRVSVTVAHLGIQLEHQHVDLMTDRPALAKLNPNVKIPVLEQGDFVLWESHAIMQYLCERTPGQQLYPSEPRARADVQRWLFWISAHLSGAVGGIAFEKMWKRLVGAGDPDPARIAQHEQVWHQLAKVADAHLADRTWLSGSAVTLADLSLAGTLMYAPRIELPLAPYPRVQALLDRVHALPAWQQTEPSPAMWAKAGG
jgi:glutathione S-transferase